MATYATYRHVELDRVGLGKRRVLKPPGGGSSIVFDEAEHPLKPKASPVPAKASAPEKAPPSQETAPANPETNGTASSPPDTPATATSPSDSFPSVNGSAIDTPAPAVNGTATNGTATNGTANNGTATNGAVTNGTATNGTATNGTTTSSSSAGGSDDFPAVNGSGSTGSTASLSHGSVSQGTPSSHSSPSTPSTPSSARLNTQNRLFGADPVITPSRRIRDHQRSSIFTPDNTSHSVTNGTPKPVTPRIWNRRDPVTGVGVVCWDHAPRCKRKATPSVATESSLGDKGTPPEQPKQQRQRIPPGGFSTQLW